MNAEQFAYWLQGFAELQAEPPSVEQWTAIKDHLALVFEKVTPLRQAFETQIPTDYRPQKLCSPNTGRLIC